MEEWMRPGLGLKKDLFDLLEKIPYNCKMVEIGCYSGESSEIFCSSEKIIEFTAVDPWENGYDNNDSASFLRPMQEVENKFDERMKNFTYKFTKLKMKSEKAFEKFEDKSLDLVYIDGIHTYEFVKKDIIIWLPKIKNNGFISGHDFHLEDVRKAVLEKLQKIDYRFCGGSWLKKI